MKDWNQLVFVTFAPEDSRAGSDRNGGDLSRGSFTEEAWSRSAVVGKDIDLQGAAYKSIYESLTHAAASQDCWHLYQIEMVDAETLEWWRERVRNGRNRKVAGVLIPGRIGERGVEEN